jgi:hypothetical protein
MDDKTQFEIATELKGVVKEQTQPLAKRIDELADSLDELHKRPIPNDGKDGVDGADGQDGAKGDTGEKGVDGVGFDAPVYESGVYREGSVVQAHFGQVYKALKDTAEGVDSEDWERVGTAGFRLTGTYEAEKEYVAGDLFIKGFGLFLHDGAEARLIAGRGPEGKKGEKGATGKDGKDGQDGKDGSTFEALEIKGTNLVAVMRTSEGLQEHAVDLAPFLEATVEVTKSVSEAHTDEAMKALDNQFKSLWETFQQHLTDQQATPVRFFRGGYTPSVTYQAGDLVNFSQSLYVAKQASTGILPHGQLAKDVKSGDYWAMLTSGGGGGGGGDTELSLYVKRPAPGNLDKWMVYNDAKKQWAVATTDLIETNSSVVFRDSAGRFKAIDVPDLKNQLEVNRWLLEQIEANADSIDTIGSKGYDDTGIKADLAQEIQDRTDGDADLQSQINDLKKLHEAPELPPDRFPIFAEDEPTEYPHAEDGEPNDLQAGDQWYEVTDPDFDYDNPDPEGLDLYVWTNVNGTFEWVLVEPPVEYVKKEGGDDMEGPLNMKNQPGGSSRDTNRVHTLGVFSNSSNSYLGLGTDGTKVYVGNDDTSFVKPIKVAEIQSKNDGDGIKISDRLDFGQHDTLMKIDPDSGTTQNIELFSRNETENPTTLQFSLHGATWKNAIEFEAGSSGNRETVLRIGSDKGLKARNLNMDDTQITKLANPVNDTDAANKQYVDHADSHLQAEIEQIALGLETLLTQRTHGKWKYVGFSGDNIPRNAGEFALASDDLSAQDNIITINLTDLNGTTIGLSDVEVGDYIEIVDDDEPANYALFTCTKEPEGTGISNIEVALKDKGNNFLIGDTCEIRFFSVNEENINLSELDDRFVNSAGDVMTGTLETPAIKLSGGKTIQEGTATRIKLNNKVEIHRVGDSKEGFTILGRNNTQLLRAYHEAAGTPDAVTYHGRQTSDSDLATVKFVEDRAGASGHTHAGLGPKGADFDYDWNQYHSTTYSGSYLNRKNSFPYNDGDWSAESFDNNYLGNLAYIDQIGRLAVQPPWGVQDWEAGYMGFIWFGDGPTSTKPIAIFQIIDRERSTTYFRWYVRLMWQKSALKVQDLDGKMWKLNAGAVYLDRGYRQQVDAQIDEGAGEQIDEVTDGSSEAGE